MLDKIKLAFVRKLIRLYRTALHEPEVREDLKGITTELMQDPVVRDQFKGVAIEVIQDEQVKRGVRDMVLALLEDETFAGEVWKKTNIRPRTEDFSYAHVPNSVTNEIFRIATHESARFAREHMSDVRWLPTPFDVLAHCVEQVEVEGLYLEFGVFSGTTINFIASKVETTVHGFDSFEGLPEQWGNVPAGKFSREGDLPEVRDNVELHVGWFDQTLPGFVEQNKANAAFIHVDADLYSSTKTILTGLQDRIVPGTVIVFDEFFNYPGWQNHEYKAFVEFIESTGYGFEYLTFANRGFSVGVKILAPRSGN